MDILVFKIIFCVNSCHSNMDYIILEGDYMDSLISLSLNENSSGINFLKILNCKNNSTQ